LTRKTSGFSVLCAQELWENSDWRKKTVVAMPVVVHCLRGIVYHSRGGEITGVHFHSKRNTWRRSQASQQNFPRPGWGRDKQVWDLFDWVNFLSFWAFFFRTVCKDSLTDLMLDWPKW